MQHNLVGNWDPKSEFRLSKGGSVQRFGMLKLNTNMAVSVDAAPDPYYVLYLLAHIRER